LQIGHRSGQKTDKAVCHLHRSISTGIQDKKPSLLKPDITDWIYHLVLYRATILTIAFRVQVLRTLFIPNFVFLVYLNVRQQVFAHDAVHSTLNAFFALIFMMLTNKRRIDVYCTQDNTTDTIRPHKGRLTTNRHLSWVVRVLSTHLCDRQERPRGSLKPRLYTL